MRRILAILAVFSVCCASSFAQAVAMLRNGDIFDMRLGGMPAEFAQEFAIQFTVGQDGTVNIPLIGEIKASGLTSTQLERTIQNRFMAEKIFTKPAVIISVAQVARFVSVSGGVRAPQRLQWNADMTISSAIGNAQGLSDFGSPKGIRIIREGKAIGPYNLRELQADPGLDPKLLPGDQVIVRE